MSQAPVEAPRRSAPPPLPPEAQPAVVPATVEPSGPRPLRIASPLRVLDGFGRAVNAACRHVAPASTEELVALVDRARGEGLPVTFRGSGRSYGDASLGSRGLVIDPTRLDHVHSWDPTAGIIDAEPGLTIEGLWRRTLEDGYWPAVVPGTMRPTLGGCLSANVHGKNNFRAGPIGEHVVEFELVTPRGERLVCSQETNADVFHAAIGGFGLLGAITRVKLRLKHVGGGQVKVVPLVAPSLGGCFDLFEESLPGADYLVGWIDCVSGGSALGRGVLHRATYLHADEDPGYPESLHAEKQSLPGKIMGLPRSALWKLMRPWMNDVGVRFVNAAKYHSSRWHHGQAFVQSHVGFAFLLDYVPNWRLSYGPTGFIQYQMFVPKETAREVMRDVIRTTHRHGIPSYLGVLKRHRPDAFLLSHAVDGWSLAMDFRVPPGRREALWRMTEELTARVLDGGGRFYFAKDAVLRPADVERALGKERLDAFFALKRRLDPDGVLESDLSRRVFGERMK